MVLTIPTTATPINTGAFGGPQRIQFQVDSDVDLTGNDVYLRLASFLPLQEPQSSYTTVQQDNYRFNYNSPNTFSLVNLTSMHPTLSLFNVSVIAQTTTTFFITIDFLYKADRLDYDSGTIPNVDHFQKATIQDVVDYQNIAPSIYNQRRLFRAEVYSTQNATNNLNSNIATFDQPISASFWCSDFDDCTDCFPDGCILPIFNSATFALTRNNQVATTLSDTNPTDLTVTVELGEGVIDSFYIAAYRTNGQNNNARYWDDIDLAYVHFAPALSVLNNSPFQTGPFQTGPISFVTSNNTHTAVIPLSAPYFEDAGEYRFFVVINHGSGKQYSCYSPLYIVDDDSPATFGPITGSINDYSSLNNQYDDFCVRSAACGERLKFTIDMDADAYNENAIANGISGDFQSNLQGIGNRISETLPTVFDDFTVKQRYQFELNETGTGGCAIVRIPNEWAGQIRYLVFTYVFKVTLGSDVYYDRIVRVFKIKTNEVTTNITLLSLADADGNDLTANNFFCDDINGPITAVFENALGDSYDFIPMIQQGSTDDDWNESNGYPNDSLPQLSTDAIISSSANFATGTATVLIDPTKLAADRQYCLKLIAKETTITGPPPSCLGYTLGHNVETLVVDKTNSIIYVKYRFNYNATIVSGTLEQLEITAYTPNSSIMNPQFAIKSTLNGSHDFDFQIPFNVSNSTQVQMYVTINTIQGCTYSESFILTVSHDIQ